MGEVIVHLADMHVSTSPGDVLTTRAIGSAVGVALYDPANRVAGLIHCMLPLSTVDAQHAQQNPCIFVDSGLPALLSAMRDRGCRTQDLLVRVAGAADHVGGYGNLAIGERNYAALRRLLNDNALPVAAEDVGGHALRSLRIETGSGRTVVSSHNQDHEL